MTRIALLAVLLVGCGGAEAVTGLAAETTYQDESEQSIEQFARGMMENIQNGNFAELKATACPEAVMYDFDENNNPIALRGSRQIGEFFDHIQQMVQSSGMTMQTTIGDVTCRGVHDEGWCTIEFDQSITVGGQTVGPAQFRGTLIAARHAGRWIWTHWHGSFRTMPTAPPPTEGAPAAPPPAHELSTER